MFEAERRQPSPLTCFFPVVCHVISGPAASRPDRPILAPAQKRNNLITVFKTGEGIQLQVHDMFQGEKKNQQKKKSKQNSKSNCSRSVFQPFT